MTKKIIAILAALTLVISLAACGSKTTDETTTEEITSEEITDLTDEVTDATEATEATEESVTDESKEEAEEDKTAESTDAEASTDAEESESETEETTKQAKPETKAEIVAYFNKSVNGVKKNAKSVTKNYSKISLAGATQLPGWANTAARIVGGADKFIDDQLTKNSQTEPETYTGSDIKAKFPVEGESYSSVLTEADVKSATCTEKDGKYTITIVTVPDAKSGSAAHGKGHAPKAFNTPLPAVINENVPGFAKSMIGGSAEMEYPSCTAKIVVDAKTGNVITAQYDIFWTIHFGTDTTLPFHTSDLYTIKY